MLVVTLVAANLAMFAAFGGEGVLASSVATCGVLSLLGYRQSAAFLMCVWWTLVLAALLLPGVVQ
jgi:hypothetical protein